MTEEKKIRVQCLYFYTTSPSIPYTFFTAHLHPSPLRTSPSMAQAWPLQPLFSAEGNTKNLWQIISRRKGCLSPWQYLVSKQNFVSGIPACWHGPNEGGCLLHIPASSCPCSRGYVMCSFQPALRPSHIL